jgi:hypothetical protein
MVCLPRAKFKSNFILFKFLSNIRANWIVDTADTCYSNDIEGSPVISQKKIPEISKHIFRGDKYRLKKIT